MNTRRAPGRRVADRSRRTGGPRPGRRPGLRAPSPRAALLLLAPLVVLVAVVVQAPAHEQGTPDPVGPRTVALASAHLACPSATPGSTLVVGSAGEDDGEGSVGVHQAGTSELTPVPLQPGGVARTSTPSGATVVEARGALAPALYAARVADGADPAAGECNAPVGERWFVGVGAGGDHVSRLQLVNPDAGPAVADVTLWSTDGRLEEVESRGLTIPGGESTDLALDQLAPHRDDLAMQVTVSRGRVAATVRDRYRLPGGPRLGDWLPWAAGPASTQVLPGLPRTADERTLVLVNPGDDEARVRLEVIGRDTTFAPTAVDEIRVPAGRVVVTDLTRALAGVVRDEDTALLVDAGDAEVTASMRTVTGGDLVTTAAVPPASGTSAAVVPPGAGRVLLLTAPAGSGAVDVQFAGAGPATRKVGLEVGTTVAVPVPRDASAVVVRGPVGVVGAVRTDGALLPLRELVLDQLIPHVEPAGAG